MLKALVAKITAVARKIAAKTADFAKVAQFVGKALLSIADKAQGKIHALIFSSVKLLPENFPEKGEPQMLRQIWNAVFAAKFRSAFRSSTAIIFLAAMAAPLVPAHAHSINATECVICPECTKKEDGYLSEEVEVKFRNECREHVTMGWCFHERTTLGCRINEWKGINSGGEYTILFPRRDVSMRQIACHSVHSPEGLKEYRPSGTIGGVNDASCPDHYHANTGSDSSRDDESSGYDESRSDSSRDNESRDDSSDYDEIDETPSPRQRDGTLSQQEYEEGIAAIFELNRIILGNFDLGAAQVQMSDYCGRNAVAGFTVDSCEDTAIGYMAAIRAHPGSTPHSFERNKANDGARDPWSFGASLGYTWVPDGFEISGTRTIPDPNRPNNPRRATTTDFSGHASFHSAHALILAGLDIWDVFDVDTGVRLFLTGKAGAHYSKLDISVSDFEDARWHWGEVYGGGLQFGILHFGWERRISDEFGDVDMITAAVNFDLDSR